MWHPSTEAEACCELSALLEFLRATKALPDLTPKALRDWHLADPVGFGAAFGEYDPNKNTAAHIATVFEEWQAVTS